ncbi:glucooligosaccharide oxidase [Pelomyxa schiedti]|nr:glucooligosaccharide oxidase [Pelomyxa schiedti]
MARQNVLCYLTLLLFSLGFFITSRGVSCENSFTGCSVVSGTENSDVTISLEWSMLEGAMIGFRVTALSVERLEGYVAVGAFASSRNLGLLFGGGPVDVWVIYPPGSAKCQSGCVEDSYFSMMKIHRDESNDLFNSRVTVSEDGRVLYAEFERKLITGDSKNDSPITENGSRLVWAYRKTSLPSNGKMTPTDMGFADSSSVTNFFHLQNTCHTMNLEKTRLQGNQRIPRATEAITCNQNVASYTSTDGIVSLSWWPTIDGDAMTFVLTGATLGWVSLGINNLCSMTNADKVTGWVDDSDSTLTILDTWSTGYSVPALDTSRGGTDDLTLTSGWQNVTHTQLTWTRKFDTGDDNDFPLIDTPYTLMWAIGLADGISDTYYRIHPSESAGGYGCDTVNFFQCVNVQSEPLSTSGSLSSSSSQVSSLPSSFSIPPMDCDVAYGSWTSPNGVFRLDWSPNADDPTSSIDFVMTGETLGWISFGLNSRLAMDKSDKYVGWVKNGDLTLIDAFGDGWNTPAEDTTAGGYDNILNPVGFENATHTVIKFTRYLDTGDEKDYEITPAPFWLLWAWDDKDGLSPSSYPVHGWVEDVDYGGVELVFYNCTPLPPQDDGWTLITEDPGQALALSFAIALIVFCAVRYIFISLSKPKKQEIAPIYEPKLSDQEGAEQPLITGVRQSSLSRFLLVLYTLTSRRAFGLWSFWALFLLLLYILANFAWAVCWILIPWKDSSPPPALSERAARTFGDLAAANMMLTILPATRNSLLMLFLHTPFDRTLQFHRFMGWWTFFLVALHAVCFAVARAGSISFQTRQVYGFVSAVCLLIVVITALPPFRRRAFSFFYFMHFFFVPTFLLAAAHNRSVQPFFWTALGIYLLDRVLRFVWCIPTKASKVAVLDESTAVVQWPKRKLGYYTLGQYVFVNFPQLSPLEWHPFSVTSSPKCPHCEVHIKALGHHTQSIVKFISNHTTGEGLNSDERTSAAKKLWIRVDGPYGHLMIPIRSYPVVSILAMGGIAITPALCILRDLYGVDSAKKPQNGSVEVIYLSWGVREFRQYQILEPVLGEFLKQEHPRLFLTVYIEVAAPEQELRAASSGTGLSFKSGWMKPQQVLTTVAQNHMTSPIGVCACGPAAAIQQAWDCCTSVSCKGHRMDFHFESFMM